MIYELADGSQVDTARDLDFEERNFIQKMMIYKYLRISLEDFQKTLARPGQPGLERPLHPGQPRTRRQDPARHGSRALKRAGAPKFTSY